MLCLTTQDAQKQSALCHILNELSYIYSFISCLHPKEEFSIQEFEHRSTEFQVYFSENWSWINLGHYFHIVLAHTVEILKHSDSVGLYSCQGKEAKNKQAKMYSQFFARKMSNKSQLLDIFYRDFMMCSPVIIDIGNPQKVRKCRKCQKYGHNKNSKKCPFYVHSS